MRVFLCRCLLCCFVLLCCVSCGTARRAPVEPPSSKAEQTPPPPRPVPGFLARAAIPKPEPKPKPEPEPEPPTEAQRPLRVLFLGDSLAVGEFGRIFDQKLRDAGFEVYTSVAGGGTPYYWLGEYPPVSIDITYWERTPTSQRRLPGISPVPKVERLLAMWKPDIVAVQTGTNLYAPLRSKKRTKAGNVREVESLIAKMCRAVTANGRQCHWITPRRHTSIATHRNSKTRCWPSCNGLPAAMAPSSTATRLQSIPRRILRRWHPSESRRVPRLGEEGSA